MNIQKNQLLDMEQPGDQLQPYMYKNQTEDSASRHGPDRGFMQLLDMNQTEESVSKHGPGRGFGF